MGNCIRKESSTQWGGEDWDFLAEEEHEISPVLQEKKSTVTEVKLKISKKQLEELMSKVDVKGQSVQQVLSQLMKFSDEFETNRRSWKPALESIAESELY